MASFSRYVAVVVHKTNSSESAGSPVKSFDKAKSDYDIALAYEKFGHTAKMYGLESDGSRTDITDRFAREYATN